MSKHIKLNIAPNKQVTSVGVANMSAPFKTFEELETFLLEEKYDTMEHLLNILEDSSEYIRGFYNGKVSTYDEIASDIHQNLKHGSIDE